MGLLVGVVCGVFGGCGGNCMKVVGWKDGGVEWMER